MTDVAVEEASCQQPGPIISRGGIAERNIQMNRNRCELLVSSELEKVFIRLLQGRHVRDVER
jgi:hypothetical protein